MPSRTLCYYVTGHGFGHAIRTVEILKALPPDIRVLVKTTAPERLFREELPGRDVRVISDEYDCGCLQSDDLTVLPRETLQRYRDISKRNKDRLAQEAAFLQQEHVGCVVSDIPSFPLRAAREAGVPGVAVANFTWADIYAEYAQTADDAQLLREMRAEYGAATVALITPLSVPTVADPFPAVEPVPLVARRGRNRREELRSCLGLPVGIRLALPYLGVWGMALDWAEVARLKEWVFLTYAALPDAGENVRVLDRAAWPYADVAASVDVVLAKPGYGTVTECIANAVPLVYVPRRNFVEQDALIVGVWRWAGGVPLGDDEFLAGRWGSALRAASEILPTLQTFATDGAAVIAEKLSRFCDEANQ